MVYLIFDTNIWIYLANGHDPLANSDNSNKHFEFLETLEYLRNTDKISILINDIIIDEWNRNKQNVFQKINKLQRKLDNADNAIKDILRYSTGFDGLSDKYKEGLRQEIEANRNHIKNVEDFLFSECINTGIEQSVKLQVYQMAVDKDVPLHKGKNNLSDITILLSAYEYLKTYMEYELPVYFVSNNWQDFTDEKDKDSFHPEIKKLLKDVKIEYERVLPKAIKLTEEAVEEIEKYLEEQHYLESIYFTCLEPLCHGSESFQPYGYLDHELDVKYKSILERDPNQLELFDFQVPEQLINRKTKTGECVICQTIHVLCPECGELNYWNWDTDEIQCRECETKMELSHSYDNLNLIVNNLIK